MTNLEFKPVSIAGVSSGALNSNGTFSAVVSGAKGCTLVELSGKFVLGEATTAIRRIFQELVTRGAQCILLDMGEISRIDSAGLGELSHFAATLHGTGGVVFGVRPLRPFLYRVLVDTKVATLMNLFEWRAPALQAAERWLLENAGN